MVDDVLIYNFKGGMLWFLEIMCWLCDLDIGCFWDIEQDFVIIVFYIIEEVYEVVDVIDCEVWDEFKGELGDLLF